MGTADRLIRLIVAIVLLALNFTHVVEGALGMILIAIAAVFSLTSMISFCPLYTLFGFTTCKVKA